MQYAIGLDIGGTKIHSVVAEWDKDFLRARKLPKIVRSRRAGIKNKKEGSKFFAEIILEIDSLLAEFGRKNVARIGVGIASPLNKDKVILNPLNLPFRNFSILTRIKEKFALPIYTDNDANCFTWAEHLFGAGHSASSTAGITLGTGVGGGIVMDHRAKPFLWGGYNGSAGEVGHMILDGKHSFEDLCSSKAEYLWKGEAPLAIEKKAFAGNDAAKETYGKYGFWLGVGVANIINVMDPEIVVIGGSLANAWVLFEEEMKKIAKRYIISAISKKTKIVHAKLGDDAGALGAAYLI